jgi:hypothetical protein
MCRYVWRTKQITLKTFLSEDLIQIPLLLGWCHVKGVEAGNTCHYDRWRCSARDLQSGDDWFESRPGMLLSYKISGDSRKSQMDFVMCVCLSVLPPLTFLRMSVCPLVSTRLSLEEFSWNCIREVLIAICPENSNLVRIWQNIPNNLREEQVSFMVSGGLNIIKHLE